MQLTLVISSLGPGGAERVMSNMANYWASHLHQVAVVTLSDSSTDHYRLDPRIRRTALGIVGESHGPLSAIIGNLRRIRALNKAIRSAGSRVVISFGTSTNVLCIAAALGTGRRVIVSERVDPRREAIGRIWERLRDLSYPRAKYIVVQTEDLRRWAERLMEVERVVVIPNSVSACEATADVHRPDARHRVLGVGRLTRQKGFDLFLRAFAIASTDHPDWDVVILGEGPERSALESLAAELGIAKQLSLPGVVREVAGQMLISDLFVLSSRYEGFPNALLEAMACGLPAISTDCPTGPRDIIRDGIDGLLVPPDEPEALATAMRALIENPRERARLSARASEVAARFDIDTIMESWGRLVSAAC